jgi:hypothetical protein
MAFHKTNVDWLRDGVLDTPPPKPLDVYKSHWYNFRISEDGILLAQRIVSVIDKTWERPK